APPPSAGRAPPDRPHRRPTCTRRRLQEDDLVTSRSPQPELLTRHGHDARPALQTLDLTLELRMLRLKQCALCARGIETAQLLQRAALPPYHQTQRSEQQRVCDAHPDSPRSTLHTAFFHARRRALRARVFASISSSPAI